MARTGRKFKPMVRVFAASFALDARRPKIYYFDSRMVNLLVRPARKSEIINLPAFLFAAASAADAILSL
jgi:hypothetical protein